MHRIRSVDRGRLGQIAQQAMCARDAASSNTLPEEDSNLHHHFQRVVCCHYTIGQYAHITKQVKQAQT